MTNIVAIVGGIAGLVSVVALLLFLVFRGRETWSSYATYSFVVFLSGFFVFLISYGLVVTDRVIAGPIMVGAVPLLIIACWLRWTSKRKTSAVEP